VSLPPEVSSTVQPGYWGMFRP